MVENNNSDNAGEENVDDSQKCCPSTSGSYSKRKLVVFVIIVVAAGIILARSLMKEPSDASDDTQQLFAAVQQENKETSLQSNIEASSQVEPILWSQELDSLASLNKVAVNQDAVFVFVPAKGNDIVGKETIDAIASAEQKIESTGVQIGLYTLQTSSPEYANLAAQLTLPGMLVMSKGRGMGAVSGEITETKILQAYVASSRAGGCGPSSSCGPSTPGCSPSSPPPGPRR